MPLASLNYSGVGLSSQASPREDNAERFTMILYISYDGLCEPLGQSQVYQYLINLAEKYKYQYCLITYEKKSDLRNQNYIQLLKTKLFSSGIRWYPLLYHKKFSVLATSFDILIGLFLALYFTIRYKIELIHVRSYVPSVISLILHKVLRIPYVFDMRGFWVDEKVDIGSWKRDGALFKVGKEFERLFLLNAEKIISLTEAAVNKMQNFEYLKSTPIEKFVTISTCVNMNLFKPGNQKNNEQFCIGYVGGAAAWYDFDLAIKFFLEFKKIKLNAHFLILNKYEQSHIKRKMNDFGIAHSDYSLVSVPHTEVPQQMNRMDVAVFFIKPYFSKIASSPTKLGELLACGVPCITTAIGDVATILKDSNVGIIFNNKEDSIGETVKKSLVIVNDSTTKNRCVSAASKYFSLDKGVEQYNKVYKNILDKHNET